VTTSESPLLYVFLFAFISSFCHLVRPRLDVLSDPIRDPVLDSDHVCATRDLSIRGPRTLRVRKIFTTTCCLNIYRHQISSVRLGSWPTVVILMALCLVAENKIIAIFPSHLPGYRTYPKLSFFLRTINRASIRRCVKSL
jgi:hypothetical protein